MSITYRGKNAKAVYGLEILDDLTFENAARDVEVVEIAGRDGEIIIDNGRYKSVNATMSFVMWRNLDFETFENQINAIKNWLSLAFGYSNLLWSAEPDYTYSARVDGNVTIKPVNETRATVEVRFIFAPVKFLTSGLNVQSLSNNVAFASKGNISAKPLLTLTGTGNVTLKINGKDFILKNITGGIIIDCEKMTATNLDKNQSQMDKVYSWPMPVLKVGTNTISWDNSSFSVTIVPRWGDLV
ncbi:hypothetical protein Hs30E_12970 [Lactococcus hodotermopsidis]|uniref:Phage tail protein n=1 Tax=Pseudolactococcus hodotermopsidis TaxID=2709157 RepID=A0A6A0BD44_9LACT|nr:phage tail domain-containing protein [Lactococcus hodotermopsidis]GFH42746.1 hypothetical protein Hs30E_12970 [Lactococcus hodotermopsidis]